MNSRVAILSAIPAELSGFPEEDWESQILYTGVGKINATKALMEPLQTTHFGEQKYILTMSSRNHPSRSLDQLSGLYDDQ